MRVETIGDATLILGDCFEVLPIIDAVVKSVIRLQHEQPASGKRKASGEGNGEMERGAGRDHEDVYRTAVIAATDSGALRSESIGDSEGDGAARNTLARQGPDGEGKRALQGWERINHVSAACEERTVLGVWYDRKLVYSSQRWRPLQQLIEQSPGIVHDVSQSLAQAGMVDLSNLSVVTDPPYGIGYRHGKWRGKLAGPSVAANEPIEGDDRPFDPAPWLIYDNVIMWGANNYARRLPEGGGWLIWDKRNGMTSNDQADCEMAWTNTMRSVRIVHHLWNGMLKASERGERRVHPTQKPVDVMKWCLSFVRDAETIMDPYMGSGPTGIACVGLGLRFIGIEIEPKYFDIACRRIEDAYKQPRLFEDEPKQKATQLRMEM